MENDMAAKIAANPKYQKLVGTRSSFGWILTMIMMVVYYGYIAIACRLSDCFCVASIAGPAARTGAEMASESRPALSREKSWELIIFLPSIQP